MLEALQILKFIYKQDFTEDLVADERDYMIPGPVTPRAIDELMAAGKICMLYNCFYLLVVWPVANNHSRIRLVVSICVDFPTRFDSIRLAAMSQS